MHDIHLICNLLGFLFCIYVPKAISSAFVIFERALPPSNPQKHNTVELGFVQHANHEDHRTSQTQSEILRAIVALPDHTEFMAELEKFHLHLYAHQRRQESEDEDEHFLRQISTLDFAATQKESYSKRYAHTGQWLLESPDFQTWLNLEAGQHPVLWYPGNPGVGKTVITSIAVNHITENTGGRRNAIVYIYCDYTNTQTFSVENLLGSIVRQLVVQTSDPGTVADLKTFVKKTTKSRNMTEEDLSS